jgi:hypothetical protein
MHITPSDTRRRYGRRGIAVIVPILVVVLLAIGLTLPTAAPAHQVWTAVAGMVAQAQADPQIAAIQA